jgi:hypothetical protein
MMNVIIRNRNGSWDAITRYPSGIVETLTCASLTMEYVMRMQEVGMLPAVINLTVEE